MRSGIGSGRPYARRSDPPKRSDRPLTAVLPELWRLMKPRTGLMAGGLALLTVNRMSGLVLPSTTRVLIDDVVGQRRADLLVPLVAAVVAATVVQAVSSFALTQLVSKEAQVLIAELRRRLQAHVGRLPVGFYDATTTGNLVSRIMNDVEGVRNLLGTGLLELVGGVLTATVALVLMMRISGALTLLVVTVLAVFGSAMAFALTRLRPKFRERGKIQAEVTGRLTESLAGVRVVKGYHAEAAEAEAFASGTRRLLDNAFSTLTTMSLMGLTSTVGTGLVGAGMMLVAARQILAGTLTVGSFFTYTMLLGFLIAPVLRIVFVGTQLTEAVAGLERANDLLAEVPEDADPARALSLPAIRGHVEFADVTFAYEPGTDVLHGLSFTAPPGTVTALVGSSGAGKSTIISLLAAFYRPGGGRILVDGVDLAAVQLGSYRSQLGVVLQETFLFDGTIRENVAFSRPDASGERILSACRLARVDEFAERFEEGYDTVVGERGVKLSGGQRQRVSIARALLADPRILILDEATSSLDTESEIMIQRGLAYLMQGRTTFVIAHRLSTVRRADQILVIEHGRIVERGNHRELTDLGGRYLDMYRRQHELEVDRIEA